VSSTLPAETWLPTTACMTLDIVSPQALGAPALLIAVALLMKPELLSGSTATGAPERTRRLRGCMHGF
jgi:hypothetical protein